MNLQFISFMMMDFFLIKDSFDIGLLYTSLDI